MNPPTGRSFGYNQALLFAIHHFHKQGPAAARGHLQHLVDEHLSNVARIAQIEDDLESYIRWMRQTKVVVADSKVGIALDVGGFLTLGGEVSRLDITDTGYRAVILGDRPADWRQHLRLPLIQRAMAMKYGRPAQEIEVAMQNVDGTGLESLSFDEAEIARAEDELRALGQTVRQLFPSPP